MRQENYRQMIENYFVPKLKELTGDEFERQIIMQDVATPHTAKATLEFLKKHFGNRIISYKTENLWPPNSPDLNISDFCLWGDTKDKIFKEKPNNFEELKIKIIKVFSEIKKETLEKAVKNLITRFKCCIIKNGKHFTDIIKHKDVKKLQIFFYYIVWIKFFS